MRVYKDVGEIGITYGDRHFLLRPSLYNVTQLGEPMEIVRTYASVMHEEDHEERFADSLAVIYACSEDDLSEVFGHFDDKWEYIPGAAPVSDVLPIARCLLKHGVTGALEQPKLAAGEEPDYVQEFSARDHVALAVAHLGVAERDAWDMTMTSVVGAMRAKFPVPDAPGSKAPSKSEMEETLAWHDRVLAARSERG